MCKELSSSINALTYLSNRKHLESCKPWCCRYGQNRKAEIDISAEKLPPIWQGVARSKFNFKQNYVTTSGTDFKIEIEDKNACDNRFQLQ